MRWGAPRYHAVHRLLTNPVYAGAYVFGRTATRTRVDRRPQSRHPRCRAPT
ncbi:MAG: hypothetical protein E5W34_00335 [Mesorhizobium sp.]|nr:MAG: hypothetical protein E5W34_00335 [Mesorhizobium sp.]